MSPKSIDHFQVGRAGREKRLRSEFCTSINALLESRGSGLRFSLFGKPNEPDYAVTTDGSAIAYFEAEFPEEGRWPFGGEFKFPTIRWPERKWDHYKPGKGRYKRKPFFLISIRGDLGDAYYLDAKTWFAKASKEKFWGSVFYGVSKADPNLGRGLENIEDYTRSRTASVYKSKI
jgi:hypothetical protein